MSASEESLSSQLQKIQKDYPHLNIKIEGDIIIIKGLSSIEELEARFPDFNILRFLLKELDGFKTLFLPGSKAIIIFDNSLYCVVGIPDWCNDILINPIDFCFEEHWYKVMIQDLSHLLFPIQPFFQGDWYNHSFDQSKSAAAEICKNTLLKYVEEHQNFKNSGVERLKKEFEQFQQRLLDIQMEGLNKQDWILTLLLILMKSIDENKDNETKNPWPSFISHTYYSCFVIHIVPKDTSQINDAVNHLKSQGNEIINSILFDYYYSYRILPFVVDLFKTSAYEFLVSGTSTSDDLDLSIARYRQIDDMILDHILIAESSIFPPFRYLSFYHVLEYYFDKVTINSGELKEQVREIITQGDLWNRQEKYIGQLIRLIAAQVPTKIRDSEKLYRLLKICIPIDVFDSFPEHIKIHIDQEIELNGGVILPKIDANSKDFHRTLANRISKLRNCLVHTNPDYDTDISPLIINYNNIQIINIEIDMMRLLVKTVVARAGVLNL